MSALAADTAMLNFFLEPQKNKFSEEFIHLEIPDTSPVWKLLGIIAYEYANKTEHTQKIIKPMVMSLTMYLSAEYKRLNLHTNIGLEDQIKALKESETTKSLFSSGNPKIKGAEPGRGSDKEPGDEPSAIEKHIAKYKKN